MGLVGMGNPLNQVNQVNQMNPVLSGGVQQLINTDAIAAMPQLSQNNGGASGADGNIKVIDIGAALSGGAASEGKSKGRGGGGASDYDYDGGSDNEFFDE
jgi:hypothetical protein